MSWSSFKRRCWIRWCKITGAYNVAEKARAHAWTNHRDLCQNLNQLEGTVSELRKNTKTRTANLGTDIERARQRMNELMEDKLRVQRENLMDMRQEAGKLKDEIAALNEEIELMQNRLAALENPDVEKIGG